MSQSPGADRSDRRVNVCGQCALVMLAAAVALADPYPPGLALARPTPVADPPAPAGESSAKPAPARPAPPKSSKAPTKTESAPVVSRAKSKQQSRGSAFLRPPGADRYDEEDPADVPAWRQTTFFGIRAKGQFFVYVVDCSGSMVLEDRLARAKEEVRRSVRSLVEPQKFQVIFYNDQAFPMPGGLPRSADLNAKSQLLAWLRLITPDGETDPKPALKLALALRPDAIFLLSDGEFPDGTAGAVALSNARKVPIHCIDLSEGDAAEQLRQIAVDSGGQYRSRPWAGP